MSNTSCLPQWSTYGRTSFVSLVLFCATGAAACGDSGGSDTSNTTSSGSGGAGVGGGGTGTSGNGGGTTATVTVTTGPVESCDPLDGALVGTTCGIFVDATFTGTADGSAAAPFTTLSDAVDALGTQTRIYVCATTSLDEPILLPGGNELHGGLDCSDGYRWSFATRTPWTAPADATSWQAVPLIVDGDGTTTVISGFDITARSAISPGGSSMAAIFDRGTHDLSRMSFVAGDAVAGADGAPPNASGTGQDAYDGIDGGLGGGFYQVGGQGGRHGVGPTDSVSGNGGQGAPSQANGGIASIVSGTSGGTGGPGAPGANGSDGVDATLIGFIGVEGYLGIGAQNGANGTAGGGGGGGGAYKPSTISYRGGGGGGGGGIGVGGKAGAGGGASFAIISLSADLQFSDVTASVGAGGDGGSGSAGAVGGPGGAGGVGDAPGVIDKAGNGGPGGKGGDGGTGGSGTGGHAAIVAYTLPMPSLTGLTPTAPQASQAGVGPAGAADGFAAVSLELPLSPF